MAQILTKKKAGFYLGFLKEKFPRENQKKPLFVLNRGGTT